MNREIVPELQYETRGPHSSRRPAWRQRLVQAERGLVKGVRSDSAFFVHFFGGSIALAVVIGNVMRQRTPTSRRGWRLMVCVNVWLDVVAAAV